MAFAAARHPDHRFASATLLTPTGHAAAAFPNSSSHALSRAPASDWSGHLSITLRIAILSANSTTDETTLGSSANHGRGSVSPPGPAALCTPRFASLAHICGHSIQRRTDGVIRACQPGSLRTLAASLFSAGGHLVLAMLSDGSKPPHYRRVYHARMIRKTAIASAMLALSACKGAPPQVTVVSDPPASVAPGDFALDTVVGLLRSGVTDGPSLEARINDPASGINNVDVDKDGKTDYVNVEEAAIPSGKKMELVAQPSSGQGPDTPFAAIRFAPGPAGVDVQAGYAPLVDPVGRYYYHDTLASDLAFAAWLFLPSRPYYVSRAPVGYVYRSRVPAATFTQTRTTFTQTTRVSPVAASPRPASFNAARLTSPPRPAATTLAQASQGTSAFRVDSRAKPAATGFAPSPSRATSTTPASRPSSPGGSRPSPSRGKSR